MASCCARSRAFRDSVNFEYVDKVIIPELHYNNSRMSQFYMRFVRFTSQHEKDIYFVTYLGSIESNQMQMVLAKEKINLFMRGKELTSMKSTTLWRRL